MRSGVSLAAMVCVLSVLTGCISVSAWVDPSSARLTYSNLVPARDRLTLGVLVEFSSQRKGPKPAGTAYAREAVIQTLQKSKLFASVSSGVVGTDATIEITIVNTVGQIAEGSSKAATLATLGAVGATTIDPYVFTAVYHFSQGDERKLTYENKIYGRVGGGSAPVGVEPLNVEIAFSQMIEQFVLRLLKDLQAQGLL